MEITEIKKTYITPEIELIVLDNEISLAMESDNNPETEPVGGPWGQNQQGASPAPFKDQMG